MKIQSLAVVLAAIGLPALATQTCDTHSYPLSTPTERFKDNGDGTLTDTLSGLMWMRCSLGQKWNGKTCAGDPASFNWESAQGAATTLNAQGGYASFKDWRMPHIPELAMIVERQCADPRVNLALFPATPSTYFWTATPRRGKGQEGMAYRISFGPEGASASTKTDQYFARLVRAAK